MSNSDMEKLEKENAALKEKIAVYEALLQADITAERKNSSEGIASRSSLYDRIFQMTKDASRTKQIEKELRTSREHFYELIMRLPIGVLVQGPNAEILINNHAALEMLGISEDQLLGKTSFDPDWNVIHEDGTEFPGPTHPVPVSIRTAKPVRNIVMGVFRPLTKDRVWLLVNAEPFLNEDGTVRDVICTFSNITDRKKDEEHIRKLSKAVEQSPASILITDNNGIIEYVNLTFSRTTGWDFQETVGKNPSFIKSGDTPPETYTSLWNTILSGKNWRGEIQNRRKNGDVYWDSVSISPLFSETGEIINFVSVQEDITERKKLEEALMRETVKAVESERLKSAFVANISHELRTPLNSIIGYTDMIIAENSSSEMNSMLNIVRKSGDLLLNIINDIMDFSKIESGQMQILPVPYSLKALMENISDFIKILTAERKKNIIFRTFIDENISDAVMIDEHRVLQILNNLLSNSVKFTDRGFIDVKIELKKGFIEFSVSDTGKGISQDYYQHIFEPFSQEDISDTRTFGGTGLGLAICRKLAELMDGSLSFTSSTGPDSGTAFFLRLPYYPASKLFDHTEISSDVSETETLSSRKILLAEDDLISQRLIKRLLSKAGCTVITADNGQEAVKAYTENEKIDLVIMDNQMPVKTGLEAIMEIRNWENVKNPRTKIPIIMLSAAVFPEDIKRGSIAGADLYMTKPVNIHDLKRKIIRLLQTMEAS